jgi:DNA-binding transcriptional ArsR family regulator
MKKQPTTAKTEEHAALFKALSDPSRLKIVHILCHQSQPSGLCVNALAGMLGITQSAVSQHLRVLKNVGLVSGERQGYHVHYAVDLDAIKHFHEVALGIHKED